MDRRRPALLTTLLGGILVVSAVAVASGSKLSKADRRWLEQVAPLMTPEEADLFEEVDAGDRERFRQIFWARRDPDLRTPHNELEEGFLARRRVADRQFAQSGLKGSETDMGQVFLLLGPPVRVAHGRIEDSGSLAEVDECDVCDTDLESSGIMKVGPTAGLEEVTYVTWVYAPEPLVGIPRGLKVEFRSQSTLGYRLVRSREVEAALDRARRLCICDEAPAYERDQEGRLATVAAAPGKDDDLARALRDAPDRTASAPSVSFQAAPAFFDAEGGEAYVPIQLGIEAESLTWVDDVAEVTLSGRVGDADRDPGASDGFRFRAALARDPDGRVRFDIPLPLPPGRRELRLAVRDDASGRVGARVLDLAVPDFDTGSLAMSSVVSYDRAREVEASAPRAGHAFQFGGLRVDPEARFRRDQKIGILFFVYGLGDPGGDSPAVRYAFFHDGELRGQTGEAPLPVSGSWAVGNTEIPLESLSPGHYTLVVAVTEKASDTMLTRSVDFDLEDAAP